MAGRGNSWFQRTKSDVRSSPLTTAFPYGFWPYNFLIRQWNLIHVPAFHKDCIERLRRLDRRNLDYLSVIAQLEKDEDSILIPVPPGENLDSKKECEV
jgi:hypothetical protein